MQREQHKLGGRDRQRGPQPPRLQHVHKGANVHVHASDGKEAGGRERRPALSLTVLHHRGARHGGDNSVAVVAEECVVRVEPQRPACDL